MIFWFLCYCSKNSIEIPHLQLSFERDTILLQNQYIATKYKRGKKAGKKGRDPEWLMKVIIVYFA